LEVNTFPDALAALAAIRDRSVDVVICDYNMQHMSGVDLIERIREAQPTIAFIRTVSANQIGRVAAHKIAAYPASAGLEDFGSAVLEAIEESSKISG
jgi:DNA-binding NtrC family response regulator